MKTPTLLLAGALGLVMPPHRAPSHPPTSVDYTLTVDSARASSYRVSLTIHGAASEFRVAMATHTEYDDQYWRYLSDLTVRSARGTTLVVREDSSVWRVTAPAGDVTISYRIQPPPTQLQAAWRAHLTPSGGLVGGPHSFMYVVDAEQVPVTVTLALPAGWNVATGLRSTGARAYSAPSAEALIDSPILVGAVRTWRFDIERVPHEIAFLGRPGGAGFDSALFVSKVERLARESVRLFGRMPYDRFVFLFEDSTSGGLEHRNSVTVGTQSANIARNHDFYLEQLAHEYFHTWNEVHLRPVAWTGLRHVSPAPTGELWFSEGVTMYFADLLLRRAGLATQDSTRIAHVERLMTTYLANPSHAMVSPEETSRAFNRLGATGDYTPNMFTQGELLGVVLDLMIRDGSAGRRSLDDVMRAMSEHFTLSRGFTGADVERAVASACACNPHLFFEQQVRSAHSLDFGRWLAMLGLRHEVSWSPARSADGTLLADLRVTSYVASGESTPRLIIGYPGTVWGHAGLHTGDRIVTWNGDTLADVAQMRTAVNRIKIGDTVRVAVLRDGRPFQATVHVAGYDRPTVRIAPRADATVAQRELLAKWAAGT